jgi:hypothetical protein
MNPSVITGFGGYGSGFSIREKYKYFRSCDFYYILNVVCLLMDDLMTYPPDNDIERSQISQKRMKGWQPERPIAQKPLFSLGRLQIAGILLIIVFIWGLISAVAVGMFEIHILALTEYEDDGKGDVYGYVLDEEGIALKDAYVAIHGTQHYTRTNPDGYYSFENVKQGNYEIEASKEGYSNITKRVTIESFTPAMVSFTLKEGGYDEVINERYGSNLSDLRTLNRATAVVIMVYGSFALLGGILAFIQRYYWLVMFGALCGIVSGMLSIGIIIAPILSIIALYYIVKNQEEFVTSETSIMDRIFGVRKPESRPVAVSRQGAKKYWRQKAPQRYEAPSMMTRYEDSDFQPSVAPPPMMEEEPASDYLPPEPPPSEKCRACGGAVKSEAQAIICICGVSYHKFCAASISECKSCGEPL